MARPFILGVTGVIGSGKSTLCKFLHDHRGFHWISADAIVHDLYRADQVGYRKIKEYFGEQFVGKKGVHRGRLRRLVLHKPEKLWILNKLIHPLVLHEVNKKIVQLKREAKSKKDQGPLKICLEAIYFEQSDLGKFLDRLFIIDAKTDLIMKRLALRKVPKKDLLTLVKFQRRHLPQSGIILKNDDLIGDFTRRADQALRCEQRDNIASTLNQPSSDL